MKDGFVAHALHHTCDPRFQNCGFTHTGDEGETRDGEEQLQVCVKKGSKGSGFRVLELKKIRMWCPKINLEWKNMTKRRGRRAM